MHPAGDVLDGTPQARDLPSGTRAARGPAAAGRGPPKAAPLKVVATLSVYADIAKAIGGAEVEVSSIANPNEDAHFVRPKPSFALEIRRADVFTNTRLD